MNIWALRKDARIKQALLLLSERLSGFRIDDDDPNEQAVRLTATDDSCSVYLYTYGQNEGRYGIHLEYPTLPDLPGGRPMEMQEDLDFEQLADLVGAHFFTP